MQKLIYGKGINDLPNSSFEIRDNKLKKSFYYAKWHHMLMRCYCKKYLSKKPTYIGCTVCPEWFLFSKFKEWMKTQDWKNKHLDKDLKIQGNKIYSPKTCIFISPEINTFFNSCTSKRGKYPKGVYFDKKRKAYVSCCHNPFTKKDTFLGRFSNPDSAHKAWVLKKQEFLNQYVKNETDIKIKSILSNIIIK